MRIETYGQQLEVTPAIQQYIETKFQRLSRYSEPPFDIRVQLAVEKSEHRVEATVTITGNTLHAASSAQTMYAAIDLLADKLDRMLLKHKEKKHDHHSAPPLPESSI